MQRMPIQHQHQQQAGTMTLVSASLNTYAVDRTNRNALYGRQRATLATLNDIEQYFTFS